MPRLVREALTLRALAQAKPKNTLYRLRDTDPNGLILRVSPTGKRTWAITWGRGQERVIGSYPTMTLDAARSLAKIELGEVAQHGAPVAVIEANKPAAEKPITLSAFVADHFAPWALANQKAGQATVDALEAVFGCLYERELRTVSAFDVERIKAQRLKAGLKPSTVNRDLDRIRKVYSCAVEWDFLHEHPLRKVKRNKVDNARVRYLSDDEEVRLRAALDARESERRASRARHNAWHAERGSVGHLQWPEDGFTDHIMPMVLLALNTGLRRGEVFGLDWRSVNLPAKLLTVTASSAKSGKTRHLPLNDEALDVLTRWKKQHGGDGLVFPSAGGARFGNINKAWGGIVRAAPLTDFHFHDLRHDFASKLVMAGVDLNTVRELMGHADIKMTLRYAHLAPGKLAAAVVMLRAVG